MFVAHFYQLYYQQNCAFPWLIFLSPVRFLKTDLSGNLMAGAQCDGEEGGEGSDLGQG